LKKYRAIHDDQLPPTTTDLQPYFDVPVSEALLQRYSMAYTGNASDVPNGKWVIKENLDAAVDSDYDTTMSIGLDGSYGVSGSAGSARGKEFDDHVAQMIKDALQIDDHTAHVMAEAVQAYAEAHPNQSPKDVADLQPYLSEPIDADKMQKLVNQMQH
jgi:hypothetical protein